MASSTWLADGEKYALVGLSLKVANDVPSGPLGDDLWVLADTSFEIPDQWRQWLGTIRTGELEQANVFLFSKLLSRTPSVLDDENKRLTQRVYNFYAGLLVASRFAPAHRPVLLTGAMRDGEIDVRQQQTLEAPVDSAISGYPEVAAGEFTAAAGIARAIGAIPGAGLSGGHWRLFRALHVYLDARTTADPLERLHQYCRTVEGLIAAEAGETRKHFKSRTELFVGPHHHDLMGAIYDVRCNVEHLHEDLYLLTPDRELRLGLVKQEAIIEHLARRVLARILTEPALWPHFANRESIKAFWALPRDERERLWGAPFDPKGPLADFDPRFIHDGMLGL